VAGFLDVLLRGMALCGQAAAIGGVLFALLVVKPAARERPALSALLGRLLSLIAVGAFAVTAGQLLTLGVQQVVLAGEHGWPIREVMATAYFEASVLRVLVCLALIVGALRLRRRLESRGWWTAMVALTVVLAASSAAISHAAARMDHGGTLRLLDAVHQYAASAWVGGLMHLSLAAFGRPREPWP